MGMIVEAQLERSIAPRLTELKLNQGIKKSCSKDNTSGISLGNFLHMTPS